MITARAGTAGAMLLSFSGVAGAAVTYELTAEASFVNGCFPPCLCPVWITGVVEGTFRLDPIEITGTLDTYAVNDIEWVVTGDSPGVVLIATGQGIYQVFSEFAVTHRLELDLVVDQQPVQHFDSGWVVSQAPFPHIDIDVAVNGFFCFDAAFYVDAEPLAADVNEDGVVNVQDLVAVILQWGPCPEPPASCDADVDGDGTVSVIDLVAIVLAWTA